ncbi:MAG: polymer-forming cytoskeletal protein [Chlamydiae bacterium]|nr:polymer-forming cytoskeletal protein [Chlamydiota bacterium]
MFKKNSKGILEEKNILQEEYNTSERDSLTMARQPYSGLEQLRNKVVQKNETYTNQSPEIHIKENAKVEGSITFESFAIIDGYFKGEILSKGSIKIGPQAIVKADLHLEEAYIEGIVEGDLCVSKKLVLKNSAKVTGDIVASSITVDEGVSILGKLHVQRKTQPEEKEEETPFKEEPLV